MWTEESGDDMEKRCGICNSLNSAESIYCKKCGHFLCEITGATSVRGQAPKSIWEIDVERTWGAGRITGEKINHPGTGSTPAYIVCPACGSQEPLVNGRKPLFCSACNYIFQESDKPFQPTAVGENITIKTSEPKRMIKGRGPMRSAKEDHSFLRFIGVQETKFFVLEMHKEEEILGTGGTTGVSIFHSCFFHDIKPQQLKISHSPAGWYLQALDGKNVWNGDVLQRGMSRRLADGDFIYMGDCILRVELFQGQKNSNQTRLNEERYRSSHFDCRHPLTSLRLLGMSKGGYMNWTAKPELNVLRTGAADLQIWYCTDGQWKIRPAGYRILLDGVELNQGFAYPVADGNQINMDEYILQVEITRRTGEGG